MPIELILGLLVAAQGGLLSFYIHHIVACNKRDRDRAAENLQINTALASIAESQRRMQIDIGTHETGLRGQVHKLASDISPYIINEQRRRGE